VPRHSETRILRYPADVLYGVTADVERYPEFLPWCTALRVLSREKAGAGEVLQAEMQVGFGAFTGRYVSRVVLNPSARTIDVTQERGPFRHLENRWRFTTAGEGTKVEFLVAFAFRNPIVNAAASGVFEHAVRKMSAAFEERARAISPRP
jgi:coenzyme Q-binding protein COQ10